MVTKAKTYNWTSKLGLTLKPYLKFNLNIKRLNYTTIPYHKRFWFLKIYSLHLGGYDALWESNHDLIQSNFGNLQINLLPICLET